MAQQRSKAGASSVNAGKGAIFDLDGTLLDSMGVWDQIDIDFLHRRGFEVPADYMSKVSAMQFQQIAEYTIARFGLRDSPQELMDEWNAMAQTAYSSVVEAKPHAAEYLQALKDSGARLAVATSLPPELREPAMEHVGIAQYFDVLCSVDDAGDVGKDRPDVYLLAARRLGVQPADCTVFEDLLEGIRSAKSADMKVWAMHDDSSNMDWDSICGIADGVLFDFSDAPTAL
ncbi:MULTISPECIES: HAD family hydrolase [Bifidobacterium]|jgi:HAD superfamily hydrolase (TIGR01509 family)|uniref:HAD family phosphatase n=1 Tax=Bifidobacterium tibiigranuli TaxID=2172043 RepID=A0A5N6RVW6_9BIFI|nr:HAD family phosphatase [Bifidobacterium tibiigranuli]KAE8126438.1 HAD family phosphatase [Bifidobacterium tibiigranuli]KAE8126495.1 HAD family phosphatase [Bifidobacterium tibiigranuli]MCH3974341.1 HAD family phosphatase [Bifidobacterium tibiigranuli]MCH4188904.1 HAD family phosphatase [Bifidobacterium tibiigranuli]MCH4203191.1 HAD family phosphatase [Bifidobacterium tibiigranuli]